MDISTSLAVMIGAKMLLTMSIVVAASFLVERSGPFLGAMIATLPISAGPSYVFLAMDHGAGFIAQSAVATIITNGVNAILYRYYADPANHQVGTSIGRHIEAMAREPLLSRCLFQASAPTRALWPRIDRTCFDF
jgi:hypothetical protein